MEEITLEQVELTLPKLGKVIVKELTLGQSIEAEKKSFNDKVPLIILWICLCTYNADGTPKYSIDDVVKVANLPKKIMVPLTREVLKINWLDEESQEEIKKTLDQF